MAEYDGFLIVTTLLMIVAMLAICWVLFAMKPEWNLIGKAKNILLGRTDSLTNRSFGKKLTEVGDDWDTTYPSDPPRTLLDLQARRELKVRREGDLQQMRNHNALVDDGVKKNMVAVDENITDTGACYDRLDTALDQAEDAEESVRMKMAGIERAKIEQTTAMQRHENRQRTRDEEVEQQAKDILDIAADLKVLTELLNPKNGS